MKKINGVTCISALILLICIMLTYIPICSASLSESMTFDFDTENPKDDIGYKPYFYWWNDTDATLNKHNVTMATHKLTADMLSTYDNQYNNSDSSDDGPEWDNGFPYWEVYFNYTAKQAWDEYLANIVLKLGAAASWENATGGKQLLSKPDADDDDREVVTVTLSAGGVTFYSKTLATSSDGDIDANITVNQADLKTASKISSAYFKLKVTGHDIRPIDMTGSVMLCDPSVDRPQPSSNGGSGRTTRPSERTSTGGNETALIATIAIALVIGLAFMLLSNQKASQIKYKSTNRKYTTLKNKQMKEINEIKKAVRKIENIEKKARKKAKKK